MGILTDYFVGTPEQASAAADHGPGDDLAPLRAKFLDPFVLVGALWEAVRHGDLTSEPEHLYAGGDRVDGNDDEGPYLFRLQPEFVAELAALPDERVGSIAEVWSTAEEWTGPITPEDAAGLAVQLRSVARRALSTGNDAYCWMCL